MNNYRMAFGLASLLLLIPAPTLIYQYFIKLAESGSISILDFSLYGFQAQFMLIILAITSAGLFAMSLRELGGYFRS